MFKGLMGGRSTDRLDETASKSSSSRRKDSSSRKDRDDNYDDDDRSVAASHSSRRRKRTDSSQVSAPSSSSKRKSGSSRGDDREVSSSHRTAPSSKHSNTSSSRRHRGDDYDDARSEVTSRSRGDPDAGESREKRKERRREHRDRSGSRDREERRRERRETDMDMDQDRHRRERQRTRSGDDDYAERSRAVNAEAFSADINSPGFSQFPSQYDNDMPGPPRGDSHQPSTRFDPRVTQQFPGQFHAPAAGAGLAAEYYGDQGQSVQTQPGYRPDDPRPPTNTQPHLMQPSTTSAPPVEPSGAGQAGAAASFFTSPPGNVEGYPDPSNSSRPPKPPKPGKPGKTSSTSGSEAGAATYGIGPTGAALGGAALGAGAAYAMGHHSSSASENRPEYNQAPAQYGIGTYPQQSYSGPPPSKVDDQHSHHHSTSNAAYVAAGAMGAAGLAAAAGHGSHSGSSHHSGNVYQHGSLAFHQRHHRGPLSRFVDFWRDPDGVAQFEEYSEAIGVCRYCFEPGTTSRDAPRKHRYRRRSSNERLHSSARIDKQSRYSATSEDEGRRKKKSSKKPWIAAGLAGILAKSMFSNKDFDDTYSIRSGKPIGPDDPFPPNASTSSLGKKSRTSRRSRRSRSSSGSRSRSRSRDRVETGITADGRVYKKDPHGGFFGGPKMSTYETRRRESRSRSSSRDKRHSKMKKAALGAAVGSAAYAASKSRRKSRSRSPRKRRSRRHSSSSSSSSDSSSFVDMSRRSRQSGPVGIGSFFTAPSAKRTKAHRRTKTRSFFSFGNDSSSSSEPDLAFGTGYVKPKSGQKRKQKKKKESDHDVDAAILGLGATATALAASASHSDRNKKNGHDVVAVKERRRNRSDSDSRYKPTVVSGLPDDDDDGWESASDDESSSSVSLNLAYGDSPHSSKASLASDSGTSKWGWRWGRKKPDRKTSGHDKYSGSDGRSYIGPAAAGVAGAVAGGAIAAHSRDRADSSRTTSLQSMQNVFPVPTSDPSNFDAARQNSMSSGRFEQTPVVTTGPGSIPLQQPQPIAPVSQAVYTQGGLSHSYTAPSGPPVFSHPPEPTRFDSQGPLYDSPTAIFPDPGQRPERDGRGARRRDSSPTFSSARDPAARSAIRSSTVREPMSVQFDLTEEQAAKERRLRKQRDDDDGERFSSSYDREREERHRRRREREEELRRISEEQAQIEKERRSREREEREQDLAASSVSKAEKEKYSNPSRRTKSNPGYEYIPEDKSDDSREKSSWVAPVAAAAVGGAAAAAIASKSGHSSEETKSQTRRESRSGERREERRRARERYEQALEMEESTARKPEELHSDDQENEDGQRRFARAAASRIRSTPSPVHESYAAYFSPRGLRERSTERSSGAPSPSLSESEKFGIEYGEGAIPSEGQERRLAASLPWTVPRLNLIEPTPPHSTSGSVRGGASPIGLPDSAEESDEREEAERSPTGSKVTWGEQETREYDASSPIRERKRVDPDSDERRPVSPDPEEVVASPSTRGWDVPKAPAEESDEPRSSDEPEVIERSPSGQMPGGFGDDIEFAATLAAGAAVAGFDPSVVTDDPSYHRRDSPPGSEEEGIYVSQFARAPRDQDEASPDIESTQPVRGFVEGEVLDTPADDEDNDIGESTKKDMPESSRDISADVPAADGQGEEPQTVPTKKMSKKEKRKKKKKGSKQATEDFDEEPTPTQSEPVEPIAEERQLVEEPEPISAEQQDDLTSRERTDDNDFYDAEEGQALSEEEGKLRNGERAAEEVEEIPDDVTDRAADQSPEDEFQRTSDVEDSKRPKRRSKRYSEGDEYDESRSVVSAPTGDAFETPKKSKRKSKRHEELFDEPSEILDTPRSLDDSSHRKKSKKKKRDSTGFDESASVVSTPARIDDTKEKRKGSKDKKGGGLFSSFFGGSKSEEPEKHARPSSEAGLDDLEDDESRRKSKKKSRSKHSSSHDDYDNHDGSVTGLSQSGRTEDLDGDAESLRSPSSKRKDRKEKRRSRYEDIVESGRTSQDERQRAAVDAEDKSSIPLDGDDDYGERRSFLGQSPELPMESDGASGLRSPFRERSVDDSDMISSRSMDTEPQARSHSTPPRKGEKFVESPHKTPSRPSSPSQDQVASRRLSMLRSVEAGPSSPGQSSPTAVPLHFRRPGQGRSTSISSPVGPSQAGSPGSRPGHKRFQSTEFRTEREIRPLWLVERHSPAKHDPEPEDTFPSLPSSKTPSRSTSVEDLRDTVGYDGDYFADPTQSSPYDSRRRPVGLQIYTGHPDQDAGNDDLLGSQQATPTAATFRDMGLGTAPEGSKKEKPKYEFHSPSELLQEYEREMAGSPDFEKLPSAEGSLVGGKDERGEEDIEELGDLPPLPESRLSTAGYEEPLKEGEKEKSSGLLPAASLTALAGAATTAAAAAGMVSYEELAVAEAPRKESELQEVEMPRDPSKDHPEPQTASEVFLPAPTSSKKSKKDKKKAKKKGHAADVTEPEAPEEPVQETSDVPPETSAFVEEPFAEETTKELALDAPEPEPTPQLEEGEKSVLDEPQEEEDLSVAAPVSSKKAKRDKKKKKKGKEPALEEEASTPAEPAVSESKPEDQAEFLPEPQQGTITADVPPEEAEQSRDLNEPQDTEDLFSAAPVSLKKSKKDKKKNKKGKGALVDEPTNGLEPTPQERKELAEQPDESEVQTTAPDVPADEQEQSRDLFVPETQSQDVPEQTVSTSPDEESQPQATNEVESEKDKDIPAPAVESTVAEDEWAQPTSGKKKKSKKKNKKGRADVSTEPDAPLEEQSLEKAEESRDLAESQLGAAEEPVPPVFEEVGPQTEELPSETPAQEVVEEEPKFEDALEAPQAQDATPAEPTTGANEWSEPTSSKKKGKKGKKGKMKVAERIAAFEPVEEAPQEIEAKAKEVPETVDQAVEEAERQEIPAEEPAVLQAESQLENAPDAEAKAEAEATLEPVDETRGLDTTEELTSEEKPAEEPISTQPQESPQRETAPIEPTAAGDEWDVPTSSKKKKKEKKGKKGKSVDLTEVEQPEGSQETEVIPSMVEEARDTPPAEEAASQEQPREEPVPTPQPEEAPEQDAAAATIIEPTAADEWDVPASGKKKKGKKAKKSKAAAFTEVEHPDPRQEPDAEPKAEAIPEISEESREVPATEESASQEAPGEESIPTAPPEELPEQDTSAVAEPAAAEDEWAEPTSGKKKKGKKKKGKISLSETQQSEVLPETAAVEEGQEKTEETGDLVADAPPPLETRTEEPISGTLQEEAPPAEGQDAAAPIEPTSAADEWAEPTSGKKKKGKKNKKGKAASLFEIPPTDESQEGLKDEQVMEKSGEAREAAFDEPSPQGLTAEAPETHVEQEAPFGEAVEAAPPAEPTAADDEWAEPSGGKKTRGKKKKGKGMIEVLSTDVPQGSQAEGASRDLEASADPTADQLTVAPVEPWFPESTERPSDQKDDGFVDVRKETIEDELPLEPAQEFAPETHPEPSTAEPEFEFAPVKSKGKKQKGKKGKRKVEEKSIEETEGAVEAPDVPEAERSKDLSDPVDISATEEAAAENEDIGGPTFHEAVTGGESVTPLDGQELTESGSKELSIPEVSQSAEVTKAEDPEPAFDQPVEPGKALEPEAESLTVDSSSTHGETITGQAANDTDAEQGRRDSEEFHSYPASPVEVKDTPAEPSHEETEEPEIFHDTISEKEQAEHSGDTPELEDAPRETVGEEDVPAAEQTPIAGQVESVGEEQRELSATSEEKVNSGDGTAVEKPYPANDISPHVPDPLEPTPEPEAEAVPDTWATTPSKKKKKGKKKDRKQSLTGEQSSQQAPEQELPSVDEPVEAAVPDVTPEHDLGVALAEPSAEAKLADTVADTGVTEEISKGAESGAQEPTLQQEVPEEGQSLTETPASPKDREPEPELASSDEPAPAAAIDQSEPSLEEPHQGPSEMDQTPMDTMEEFQSSKSKKQKKKDKKKRAAIGWEDESAPSIPTAPETAEETTATKGTDESKPDNAHPQAQDEPTPSDPAPELEEFQSAKSKKKAKKAKKKQEPMPWDEEEPQPSQPEESIPTTSEELGQKEIGADELRYDNDDGLQAETPAAVDDPFLAAVTEPAPEPEEFQSAKAKRKGKKGKKKQSVSWDIDETPSAVEPPQTSEELADKDTLEEQPRDDIDDQVIAEPEPSTTPTTMPASEPEEFPSAKEKKKAKKDKKKKQKQSELDWTEDVPSVPETVGPFEPVPEVTDFAGVEKGDVMLEDDALVPEPENREIQSQEPEPQPEATYAPSFEASATEVGDFQPPKTSKKAKKEKKKKQKQAELEQVDVVPPVTETIEPSQSLPGVTDPAEKGDMPIDDAATAEPEVVELEVAEPEASLPETQLALDDPEAPSQATDALDPEAEVEEFQSAKSKKKAKKDKKKQQKAVELDWTDEVPAVPEQTGPSNSLPETAGSAKTADVRAIEDIGAECEVPVPEAAEEEFQSAKSSKKAKKGKKKQKQAALDWTEEVPAVAESEQPHLETTGSQEVTDSAEMDTGEPMTEPDVPPTSMEPSTPSEPAAEVETEEFASSKSSKKAKKDKKKKQKQAALGWADEIPPIPETQETLPEAILGEADEPADAPESEEFQSAKSSKKAKKDKKEKQKQSSLDWTDDAPSLPETKEQHFEDVADPSVKEVAESIAEPGVSESTLEPTVPTEGPEEFESAKSKKKAKKDKKKGKKALDWTADEPADSGDQDQANVGLEEPEISPVDATAKDAGTTGETTIPEPEEQPPAAPGIQDAPETSKEILEEDGDGKEFQLSESPTKDTEGLNDQEKATDWTNDGPSSQVVHVELISQETPTLGDPEASLSTPFPSISDEPLQFATMPEEQDSENVRDFETFSFMEWPSEATDEDRKKLATSSEIKEQNIPEISEAIPEVPLAPADQTIDLALQEPEDSNVAESLSRKLSKKEKKKGKKKGNKDDNEEVERSLKMEPTVAKSSEAIPSEETQGEVVNEKGISDTVAQEAQPQDAAEANIDDFAPTKSSKKKKDKKKGKKNISEQPAADPPALEAEQQLEEVDSLGAPTSTEVVSPEEKALDELLTAGQIDDVSRAVRENFAPSTSSKKKKDKKKKAPIVFGAEEPTAGEPDQSFVDKTPIQESSSASIMPEAPTTTSDDTHKDDGTWPSIDWARESSEVDKAIFSGPETGASKDESHSLDEPQSIEKVLESAKPHTIDEYDEKSTPLKQLSPEDQQARGLSPEDEWPATPTKKSKKDKKGKKKQQDQQPVTEMAEDQPMAVEEVAEAPPMETAEVERGQHAVENIGEEPQPEESWDVPKRKGKKGKKGKKRAQEENVVEEKAEEQVGIPIEEPQDVEVKHMERGELQLSAGDVGDNEMPQEEAWDVPVKEGKKGHKTKKKLEDDPWEEATTQDRATTAIEVTDPVKFGEAEGIAPIIQDKVQPETEPVEPTMKEVQADDFWDATVKKGKKGKKGKKKYEGDGTEMQEVTAPSAVQDEGMTRSAEMEAMTSETGVDKLHPESEAVDVAPKEIQADDPWDVPVKRGKKGKKGKKQKQEEKAPESLEAIEDQPADEKLLLDAEREMGFSEDLGAPSKEITREDRGDFTENKDKTFDLGTERSLPTGPASREIDDTEPELPTPGDKVFGRSPSPIDSTTKDRSSVLFHSSPSTRIDATDSNSKEAKSRTADRSERRHGSTSRETHRLQELDQETPSKPPKRLAESTPTEVPESLFGGPIGPGSDVGMGISPPRTPLDTIREHVPEDSPSHGRHRDLSDVGMPEQGTKVARHERKSHLSKSPDPVIPRSRTPGTAYPEESTRRLSSPGVDERERSMDMDRSISSRNSNRSIESGRRSTSGLRVDRLRTPDNNYPETLRPSSVGSNRSSGTPSLRRVDRSLSGDLRAASRRGVPRTSSLGTTTHEPDEPPIIAEDEEEAIPSSSTYDPVTDKGKRPARDMADVYEGWGDVREAPRSPSRPPSVRRRRSMQQVQELESRVDQLVSENRLLTAAKATAEDAVDELKSTKRQSARLIQERDASIQDKDLQIQQLKHSLEWLKNEVARLTQVNESLTQTNQNLQTTHEQQVAEHTQARQQWEDSSRELDELKQQHGQLSTGMEDIVRHEIDVAMAAKNAEVLQLQSELHAAQEKVKELQQQIVASTKDDVLVFRDEDYFEGACQKLCQHVQQWVLRFSKFSDTRLCRLTSELRDEKIVDRFENAILDGSDVDAYLADRVKRRDVFMSVVMTMVWEFIFTRYLFGMDREQRQKLKSLEKNLTEVGPPPAVHRWRATTLSLLSKRSNFHSQRENDTEAVVLEIFNTLSKLLPPPHHLENQIRESLRNVMRAAVKLSIEMRTQRAEYIMLPPLQPEYDTNGDLARKVYFNAALMNERSGETTSNEALEEHQAVVRMVLFPLVVKKGNDTGEGDDEIVVCPAQVLVAKPGKDKKVVRVLSGDRMSIDQGSRSVHSVAPSSMDMGNMI